MSNTARRGVKSQNIYILYNFKKVAGKTAKFLWFSQKFPNFFTKKNRENSWKNLDILYVLDRIIVYSIIDDGGSAPFWGNEIGISCEFEAKIYYMLISKRRNFLSGGIFA